MNWKRFLATMLAFAMIFTMMPVVRAANTTQTEVSGFAVSGLLATYGKNKVPSTGGTFREFARGSISWSGSGNSMIVNAQGALGQEIYSELTFTNISGVEAKLQFEYSFAPYEAEVGSKTGNFCKIDGEIITTTANQNVKFEKVLAAGEKVYITIVTPKQSTYYCTLYLYGVTLTPTVAQDVTATFLPAEGGSYTVDGEEKASVTVKQGAQLNLVATPAEGYQFFGWWNETLGAYDSYEATRVLSIMKDVTLKPVFVSAETAIFGVGTEKFSDLSEADTYASSHGNMIVLLNDGTVTGTHTVSAGNTLLIPYNDHHDAHTEAYTYDSVEKSDWVKPTAYRTLTMSADAKLTINGNLNVGGTHSAGPWLTAGAPTGAVGMIRMTAGAQIVVGNGGTLYCWGYIYGGGTVTAKNGATVHENIQFADFRGGNATSGIALSELVFPMTQYYVQNVEVATTYEFGAVEKVWGSIYLGSNKTVYCTDIQFIGADKSLAMFVPEEGGTVTKTYIPATDRLQIDVSGNGSINPMTVAMEIIIQNMGGPLNTATFALPIANNMTININSGKTTVNQSLALLPGVELNIAKDAILSLEAGEGHTFEDLGIGYASGHNLIIYDRDQWLNGWKFAEEGLEYGSVNYVHNGNRMQPVAYSPSWSDDHYVRTEADLVDAVVDINGKLITNGFIYTTVDIDPEAFDAGELVITGGGASVISSEGTGVLVMNNGTGPDMMTYQATQDGSEPVFVMLFMVSARLQNPDGSYLDTMGAEAGAEFHVCERCGQWYAGEEEHQTAEITWIVDGEDQTQEVCAGVAPVYAGGTPTKEGYVFLGWSTAENGTVLETLPAVNGEEVFYAIFEKEAAGLKGDLNGDGEVDANDLTLLARHVAGIELLTGQNLENADVDGNGDVDADDITAHARYVAGIITEWP